MKEQSRACSANLNEPLNGFSGFDYRREYNLLATTVGSNVANVLDQEVSGGYTRRSVLISDSFQRGGEGGSRFGAFRWGKVVCARLRMEESISPSSVDALGSESVKFQIAI